jgi:DNA repair protein RecO (recombination protein O)
MMELEKKEGIVVKATPYQDTKRIVTLFTPDGLLSLMATVYPKQPNSILLTTPLCIAEFCYKRNASDLHFLKEGSIMSSHLNYNTSYARLEAAFALLKTLLISQLPAKPAPLLYQLSKLYLALLPHVQNPQNLSSSFMLKVLRHEGLLSLEGICSSCTEHLAQAAHDGELYCTHCMPPSSLFFEQEEWKALQVLLFSKEIKTIDALETTTSLHQKICQLLKELVR